MWRYHPFSQRNRTIERTMGVGVGGDREVEEIGEGVWTKFQKKRRTGNIGGSS